MQSMLAAVLLTLVPGAAHAYEVDTWAPYERPLPDSTLVANQAMDEVLDRAIAQVRCDPDDDVLRRRLARAIFEESALRKTVPNASFPRQLGYGRYSAWLETDPSVARVTTGSGGIFEEVSLFDSPILRLAGTASSVRLAGVDVGTDKVDHFLATGFDYLEWSREGEDPERALRIGTRTERRMYGRFTSKAFSYADLEANWDGYRFYSGLLTPESTVQRGTESCLVRVRDFDWAAWVDRSWDEFQNPSVYGPRVRRAIEQAAAPDREAICAAWAQVDPGTLRRHTLGHIPPQPDSPFGLERFCQDSDPSAGAPAVP